VCVLITIFIINITDWFLASCIMVLPAYQLTTASACSLRHRVSKTIVHSCSFVQYQDTRAAVVGSDSGSGSVVTGVQARHHVRVCIFVGVCGQQK
jgi:hypothetical protein